MIFYNRFVPKKRSAEKFHNQLNFYSATNFTSPVALKPKVPVDADSLHRLVPARRGAVGAPRAGAGAAGGHELRARRAAAARRRPRRARRAPPAGPGGQGAPIYLH